MNDNELRIRVTLAGADKITTDAKSVEQSLRRSATRIAEFGTKTGDSFAKSALSVEKQGAAIRSQVGKIQRLYDQLEAKISEGNGVESKSYAELGAEIESTARIVDNLKKRLRYIETPGLGAGTSSQVHEETLAELEREQAKLSQLEAQRKAMLADGSAYGADVGQGKLLQQLTAEQEKLDRLQTSFGLNTAAIQRRESEIDQAAAESREAAAADEEYARTLEEMANSAEIADQHIVDLQADLEQMRAEQSIMADAGLGPGYAQYDMVTASIAEAEAELKAYQAELTNTSSTQDETGASANRLATSLSGIRKVGAGLIGIFASVGGRIGKVAINSIKGIGKSAEGAGAGMKRLIMYSLGIRGLYRLVRKIVSAVSEGMKDLIAQDPRLNASVNGLKASLASLKGNLAAAFAPILSAVIPILNALCNALSTAANYVAAFFAALTGHGTYKRVTSALGGVADAAAGAGDAAEKAQSQFSGLDEVTTWQSNNASGGGGGGGAGGAGGLSFEDVEVPSSLRDLIESGDWAGLATRLTDKLNSMIDSVDWAGVGAKVGKVFGGVLEFFATCITTFHWEDLGAHLGTFVNNMFAQIDFRNLGVIIAGKLKIALETITGFLSTFDGSNVSTAIIDTIDGALGAADWAGVASRLGTNLSRVVSEIDFAGISSALSRLARTILQTLTSFVTSVDWGQVGTSIANALNGLDWAGIASDLGRLVLSLLQGAAQAIAGFASSVDWEALGSNLFGALKSVFTDLDWSSLISALFSAAGAALAGATQFVIGFVISVGEAICTSWDSAKAEWEASGLSIWEGLAQGIVNAISDIGSWIYDNIFSPFIEGFKDAFGIHSPSTVMEEQGEYIMDGLKAGLVSKLRTIVDFFSTLKDKIVKACETIRAKASEKWNKLKDAVTKAAENIKTKAAEKWEALKTSVTNIAESIRQKATTVWENLKSKVVSTTETLKQNISDKWEAIKSKVVSTTDSLRQAAIEKWENLKTKITSTTDTLRSTLTSKWETIKTSVSGTVESLKSSVSEKWETLKSKLTGTTDTTSQQVTSKWETLKSTIASKTSDTSSSVQRTWDSLKASVTSTVEMLKSSITGSFSRMLTDLGSSMYSISNKIGDGFRSAKNTATTEAANLVSTVTSKFSSLKNAMTSPIESAKSSISWTISSIRSLFNFSWSLPRLKLPHISWYWKQVGSLGYIPQFSVSWYARGGIVDGASLIGAGEDGKEAIIPLERHTEWVGMVASELSRNLGVGSIGSALDTIADRLAYIGDGLSSLQLAVPQPVMASGTVTPPMAQAVIQAAGDIREIKGMLGRLNTSQSKTAQPVVVKAQFSTREAYNAVMSEARSVRRQTGSNPFDAFK